MMPSSDSFSTEIERKFLLKRLPDNLEKYPRADIEQGYLAIDSGGHHVRLRKKGDALSLTYKRDYGRSREEREIRLTAEQFEALWPATAGRRLTKIRYDLPRGKRMIEIDVYRGVHEGLVVAEVEFPDEKSCVEFEAPDWFGAEVTGDQRYSNLKLACE
jgi:adenylate cyclase